VTDWGEVSHDMIPTTEVARKGGAGAMVHGDSRQR
jgi:hypothetical protein